MITGELVDRDTVWTEKAQKAYEAQQMRRQYEKIEQSLFAELKEITNGLHSKGGGFIYTSTIRTGSIDYKQIPELKYMNLEPYRKDPIELWTLQYVGESVINKLG
jgi:hypothetical protein